MVAEGSSRALEDIKGFFQNSDFYSLESERGESDIFNEPMEWVLEHDIRWFEDYKRSGLGKIMEYLTS